MPTSSVLYHFLAEANGISMNSGLHKILAQDFNYHQLHNVHDQHHSFFFQCCGMENLAKISPENRKLIKSTLEYKQILKNKTPKFLLKPQILWEKKSLITMV
jgi:hypothetical protein